MKHKARIIQSTGKWYKVACDGEVIDCRLPGKFRVNQKQVTNPVAVGDYVAIRMENDGTGIITEIFERENYIPRQATHGRKGEQILASNIDRAWVVQSIRKPKLKQGFIDRFLVTCEAYEVPAGIIINKMDLARTKDLQFVERIRDLYTSIGYPLLTTSVEMPSEESGLQELVAEIKDQTSVFIGPSGVGKTSLLNTIDPGLNLKIGEISSYSQKGKHTTTYARLVPLRTGGMVADTPGIRELGLVQITQPELSLYFPEMVEPRSQCHYYNCTHSHEPDCGVVEAWQKGLIDTERYHSYLNMLESL